MTSFRTIADDLAFLDDWEDRYRYIIDLGQALPDLPDEDKIEAAKVKGCVSQVWLHADAQGAGPDALMRFRGDSDAHIVRGLVALVLALVNDRPARDIAAEDINAKLEGVGLKGVLSPQRSNGLASLVKRVGEIARATAARAA